MSENRTDFENWLSLIKTVSPLSKEDVRPANIPPHLRVHGSPSRFLQNMIDLHGLTIQDAYLAVRRFFILNQLAHTKTILIITGKGAQGKGKIKKEIVFWFETPFFKEKINSFKWINDGGTLEIQLTRKKNGKRKNSFGY